MTGAAVAGPLALSPQELVDVLRIEEGCFSQPWTHADFVGVARDPRTVAVGLWLPEGLVGYAIGSVGGATFYLASLAVAEPHRRRGWGSQLLGAALERARGRNCLRCRLEVRRSNGAAQGMYRKHGFSVAGVRRRFYTSPVEDAWLMARPLDALDDPAQGTAFAGQRRK